MGKASGGQGKRGLVARLVARLSYANVMATTALFVALGGGAYAALSVTGRNVVDGSLTGRDIKNHSILPIDLRKPTAVPGPKGAKGDKGDKGDTGAAGADGATGTPGAPGTPGQDFVGSTTQYAEVLTEESTTSTSPTDLGTPGPKVTVTVPASGLVSVYASARGKPTGAGSPQALVSIGTSAGLSHSIFAFFNTGQFTVRNTVPGSDSGNAIQSPGGWVVLELPPGQQTISLYYRVFNGVSAAFDSRKLWVKPVD